MEQGEILGLLALQILLIGLPGVASALFAASMGERREPVLLAVALVGSGVAAMLSFWAYYGDHLLGQTVSYLLIFGSVLVCGWTLYERRIEGALLRRLSVPLALWVLGSIFLAYFGFLHGGVEQPLVISSTRFSGMLPGDNYIPHTFAEWIWDNGSERMPEQPGDWLSSDRPPLQAGYALLVHTFDWDRDGLNYQLMGIALQQLWIVGLWALLVAGRAGRVTRAAAMGTVLLSNVAIVNGFFVWPKMLPAALLLAAAALVLTPLWDSVRRSLWGAALLAALIGLAMLGHGASVFGVLPLLVIAAYRGLPNWRWAAVAVLALVIVYAPWNAYQRYGDPPGNRLTKWFLGGAVEVDDRGIGEAVIDGYREEGVGGTLHNKGQNFVAIFGGGPMAKDVESAVDFARAGDLENAVRHVRTLSFFNLVPSLGLLLIGFAAMAIGYRHRARAPDEWRLALGCSAAFGLGALLWALLMFGGATAQTVIHQGSLLLPVLGTCAAAIGVRAVYPRFALGLLGLNAVLMLAIYTPAFETLEGTSYSALAAVLAAAGLFGFGAVALGSGGGRSDQTR